MMSLKKQQGVGLVEVLVALVILAIGILGFVALQMKALEATNEGSYRIQALNVARDLAEKIRVNRGVLDVYKTQIQDPDSQTTSVRNCFTNTCTATQLADFDVEHAVKYAQNLGMTVNILNCQGNNDDRSCVYVAWNDTSATDGANPEDCTSGTSYNPNSTCVIMEVY